MQRVAGAYGASQFGTAREAVPNKGFSIMRVEEAEPHV
jgi:hypothetical protein